LDLRNVGRNCGKIPRNGNFVENSHMILSGWKGKKVESWKGGNRRRGAGEALPEINIAMIL
jgi:hypothetical protein